MVMVVTTATLAGMCAGVLLMIQSEVYATAVTVEEACAAQLHPVVNVGTNGCSLGLELCDVCEGDCDEDVDCAGVSLIS